MAIVRHRETGAILYSGAASGMAGLDLSYGVFTGMMTSGAPDTDSDLSGVSFVGTNLNYTIFSFAFINGANFTGASLNSVDFTGATITNCTFANGAAVSCIFDQANLSGTAFSSLTLVTPSMVGAYLGATTFANSQVVNGDLSAIKIVGATMSGTGPWTGTWKGSWVEATGMTITSGQVFYGGTLKATNGVYSSLTFNGTTFLDPVTSSTVYDGSTFNDCFFLTATTGRSLQSCTFNRCDIDYDLGLNCVLSGSNFYDMPFKSAVFGSGTNMASVTFRRCSFVGEEAIEFPGSTVSSVTFQECIVDNVDFSGASLMVSVTLRSCRSNRLYAIESNVASGITFSDDLSPAYPSTLSNSILPQNRSNLSGLSSISDLILEPGNSSRGPASHPSSSFNGSPYSENVRFALSHITMNLASTKRTVGLDLGNCQLYPSNSSGGTLSGGSLQNVGMVTSGTLSNLVFMGVDLKGADFSLVTSMNCKFVGCDISWALFTSIDLSGSTFQGCNIYGTSFSGSTNVDLSGTYEATTSNLVTSSNLWDRLPLADTISSYSSKLYAVYLTSGSKYTVKITSGGGAEQQLFLMSPYQAEENIRTSFAPTQDGARSRYMKGSFQQTTTLHPEIGNFIVRQTGYHYIWLYNGNYSSSFTLEMVIT